MDSDAANRAEIASRVVSRWLARAKPGERAIYHCGELARDKVYEPRVAKLADTTLGICNGRFSIISDCGHERGEIIGTRQVELLTRRERGEMVYMAERRAP